MNPPNGKYAWTAKVGEKGQIVIPKEARDLFHIKPGDTILLLGDVKRGIALVDSSKFFKFADALMVASESEVDDNERD